VLGPPPPGRRRDLLSPASLGWAAVGFIGSMLTRTTWGLVLFVGLGVVGLFGAGLVKSRRTITSTVVVTDAQVTADKHDPVGEWLARRNQRVRSLLVFAASFPYLAAAAVGAAVGFGISTQRSCVTWRSSDRCAFYIPGHHTVAGGSAWGLLVGALAYGGALLVRQALVRAKESQQAPARSEPRQRPRG